MTLSPVWNPVYKSNDCIFSSTIKMSSVAINLKNVRGQIEVTFWSLVQFWMTPSAWRKSGPALGLRRDFISFSSLLQLFRRGQETQYDSLKWSEGSNKMIYGGHIRPRKVCGQTWARLLDHDRFSHPEDMLGHKSWGIWHSSVQRFYPNPIQNKLYRMFPTWIRWISG